MLLFDEEILFTHIGYAAGLATILTFTIQILRIIETKNVTNLSSYMYMIYTLGLVCWFAYGVYIESWILVISNLITFLCTFTILLLIIYYDAEDKIERERKDPQTGVYNFKYFNEAVPLKIAEAIATKQKYSLLLVAADNLTEIYEKYGQRNSEKVLKNTAKVLDKALRGSDMVARYDEDKFVVYLAGTDDKSIKVVAERLYATLNASAIKIKKDEVVVSARIGGCASKYAEDVEQLCKHAGEALREITFKSRCKIKIWKNK